MRKILIAAGVLLMLSSCDGFIEPNVPGQTQSWVPVYAQATQLTDIGTAPVQATSKAGKIYVFGNFIFQNDQYKGFHIIDNSVPAAAHKVGFLKVPFCTEIAIRGNFLYTNSVSDLLVFSLSNPLQPTLVKRVPNAFPLINQEYPPATNCYFECVDPSKGIVVDWELKQVDNPKCRR